MRRVALSTLAVAALALASCDRQASGNQALPPLAAATIKGRVSDKAGLLSVAEAKALSDKLAALEHRTKVQFAVATTPSLGGQSIDDYSIASARHWKLGDKGRNDGLMLLVAPNERKVRIEVGKGLERTLPDDLCARIIREDIAPHFKAGDYPAGIDAGADALIAVLDAHGAKLVVKRT